MPASISVITPVYNGRRFIDACIANVLDQDCPGLEHVLVDGGSTDGTVEVIRARASRSSHIRWISRPDRGQSDAMNAGLAMAAGEILGFLNADDFYEPGALRFVLDRFAALPAPSLLVGNCIVRGDGDRVLWINRPRHLAARRLLVGDESRYPFPVNPSAYFYHKSLHALVGDYDLGERYAMDIDFILKAVRRAHTVYVDRALGNYRYIEGTKTFENPDSQRSFDRLLREHRRRLPPLDRLVVGAHRVWLRCARRIGG